MIIKSKRIVVVIMMKAFCSSSYEIKLLGNICLLF